VTAESITMPVDIETKLRQVYPGESFSAVSASLATYQGREWNRVIRCIIYLSSGDPTRISHFVGIAGEDYRDVIYWAEYYKNDHKVR
jgi:hypothetical protein